MSLSLKVIQVMHFEIILDRMYRTQKLNLSKYMDDVCIYFRRFHKIYLSTNIKNDDPRTCINIAR